MREMAQLGDSPTRATVPRALRAALLAPGKPPHLRVIAGGPGKAGRSAGRA